MNDKNLRGKLNFVYSRNNLGKPIVFLWADALRDFVDRSSSNTTQGITSSSAVHINTNESIGK
jgi:hypothetical protein